jgi:hypothetical protein
MVTIRPYEAADWSRLCAIHDAARLDELRHSAGLAAFLTLEQTAHNAPALALYQARRLSHRAARGGPARRQ